MAEIRNRVMGKLMTEFLEKLGGDVHVDLESEEVKDICAAVDELLGRLLVNVEDVYPCFKSKQIVPCGSMAERTRIWRFTGDDMSAMLEFDFLAIMKYFVPGVFTAEYSCGGFMEVEDICQQFPREYTNDAVDIGTLGKISTKLLSFNYRLQMMHSVSSLCDCHEFDSQTKIVHGCEIVKLGNINKTKHYRDECEKCKVRKDTGTLVIATGGDYHPVELNCTIAFLWKRNTDKIKESPCELSRQRKTIKQEFIMLIDFLPAIKVLSLQSNTTKQNSKAKIDVLTTRQNSVQVHQCYLVPKGCKQEHNTCWKVSHCSFERELLRSTTYVHRECYMALKFILDYMLSDMSNMPGIPTTYILKTAVLFHIQNCSLEKPDLTKCTANIVQFLSDAHKNAFLPHLILEDQNFLAAPSVEENLGLTEEHLIWSKNRNLLLGKCWAFIIHALQNLEVILPSGFDFDKIQTVLKLTTTIYGRAYLDTTFNIIHEPYEEEFFNILCRISRDEFVSGDEMTSVIKVYGDVENKWEQELALTQYTKANALYGRMRHKTPKHILDTVLGRGGETVIYDRKRWNAEMNHTQSDT